MYVRFKMYVGSAWPPCMAASQVVHSREGDRIEKLSALHDSVMMVRDL